MQRSSFVIAVVVLVALLGAGIWWIRELPPHGNGKTRLTNTPPDVAILQLNNRGVGYMERFQYKEALDAFLQVYRQAPSWLPGHVNLGIALLNTADPNQVTRAVQIFEKILEQDPDNLHAHFCLGIILKHQQNQEEAADHFRAVTRRDPHDPHAWFFLANTLPPLSAEQQECFEKALREDPNLVGALYGELLGKPSWGIEGMAAGALIGIPAS